MLGLDPLTSGTLLILAAGNGSVCIPPKPAEINVIPKTQSVKYDTSKTMAELQSQQIDTINPYGFHGKTQTQGFMAGSIQMVPRVKLDYKHHPEIDAVCLWYDTVDIQIEIDPTIVVAKEVYADPCEKKAVIDHEMKHVTADRKIVNKYAKIMGSKVYDGLKQRGFVVGPVPSADAQSIAERMQTTVFQIVDFEYKKMEIDRQEAQGAIDSLEEYERVNNACKGGAKQSYGSKRR